MRYVLYKDHTGVNIVQSVASQLLAGTACLSAGSHWNKIMYYQDIK
jgi:hypothetical protein